MNWLKKTMLFAGIGICAIGSIPAVAKADTVAGAGKYPVSDTNFIGIEINDGGTEDSLVRKGSPFASKHDPRTVGAVSAIENQGNTDTCWAFASIAAIESNLIKKGYVNNSVNLSENHLAYFFYNRQNDPLGNTADDQNKSLRSTWYGNGGTLQGTALHLATWSGVVSQTGSEDYAAGETTDSRLIGAYKPSSIDAGACYNREYVVENVYFYDYDVNTLKQAVVDHGAVAIGFSMDFSCYLSSNEKSYYSPIPTTNQHDHAGGHAVTIVGWDDTYSKSNFKVKPSKDGAWIIKNSYGSDFGDAGYMYISYEDASIADIVAYDAEIATNSSTNVYQYDGTANPAFCLNLPSGTTYANVFKAKAASGYNELLEATSVCVATTNVNYKVQVYTGVTSTSNPTKGKKVLTQTGTLTNAGYNRIEFNQPVTLQAGEKYSIVITLSAANGGKVQLMIEDDYSAGWIAFKVDRDENVGFMKYNGKWYDCGDVKQMGYEDYGNPATCNLRIKAYTSNTQQKTSYKLNTKSIGVSKGSTQKMSLKVTPSTIKRVVKWTSTNKSVATISSSGKIKAKAYGTTTIKAKFVSGSKTKTLTCKVTVGPSKVKNFKAKSAKKKITLTWKTSSAASGYTIYYSKKKDGSYKTLATVKSGSTAKYSKKMKKGTYYVKMRPYMTQGNKKLYGSYTSVKKVVVK